jgi:hypothetical protein
LPPPLSPLLHGSSLALTGIWFFFLPRAHFTVERPSRCTCAALQGAAASAQEKLDSCAEHLEELLEFTRRGYFKRISKTVCCLHILPSSMSSKSSFERLQQPESCHHDDETGEEELSQPDPVPLPLQSQIIPTSHEFIVNICQSRLNGPLPKMLTKNKASAFTAGSSFPERSGVRKTCRYRVITKQQSPQAKNSSDKLRMILDSITSIVFASSQAPSCLDLPFQYCSGEFQQNNSEAPGSHCEHEDPSHSSTF